MLLDYLNKQINEISSKLEALEKKISNAPAGGASGLSDEKFQEKMDLIELQLKEISTKAKQALPPSGTKPSADSEEVKELKKELKDLGSKTELSLVRITSLMKERVDHLQNALSELRAKSEKKDKEAEPKEKPPLSVMPINLQADLKSKIEKLQKEMRNLESLNSGDQKVDEKIQEVTAEAKKSIETAAAKANERFEKLEDRVKSFDKAADSQYEKWETSIQNWKKEAESSKEEMKASLDRISREIVAKVERLEQEISKDVEVDLSPIESRVEELEDQISEHQGGEVDLSPIESRVKDLEDQISKTQNAEVDLSPIESRVEELEDQISEHQGGEVDLSPIESRVKDLEDQISKTQNAEVDLSPIESKIEGLENQISKTQNELASKKEDGKWDEMLAKLEEKGMALESKIESVSRGVDQTVKNSLEELEGKIERDRESRWKQFDDLINEKIQDLESSWKEKEVAFSNQTEALPEQIWEKLKEKNVVQDLNQSATEVFHQWNEKIQKTVAEIENQYGKRLIRNALMGFGLLAILTALGFVLSSYGILSKTNDVLKQSTQKFRNDVMENINEQVVPMIENIGEKVDPLIDQAISEFEVRNAAMIRKEIEPLQKKIPDQVQPLLDKTKGEMQELLQKSISEFEIKTGQDVLNQTKPMIQEMETKVGEMIEALKKDLNEKNKAAYSEVSGRLTELDERIENRTQIIAQPIGSTASPQRDVPSRVQDSEALSLDNAKAEIKTLEKLEKKAIAERDHEAYKEILKIVRTHRKPEWKSAAEESLDRIHRHYAHLELKAKSFSYRSSSGATYRDYSVPVAVLEEYLRENPDPLIRAKAAEVLSLWKERRIPSLLLEAACAETDLWVTGEILNSFEDLTGFRNENRLDCLAAKRWWAKNA